MKKILLIVSVWMCFNAIHAQSDFEKANANLSPENKVLLKELLKDEADKKQRVDLYFKSNPQIERYITRDNGQIMEVTDIIDGKPLYRSTLNLDAARATKATHLQSGGSLGLNLDGSNMTVGVWDGGPAQDNHAEFLNAAGTESRIIIKDNSTVDGDTGFSTHGTHVSGTIAAIGAVADAKGMAPNVTVKSYNWTNDTSEMLQAITDATRPIILSNHSYGVPIDPGNGSGLIDSWIMGAYTTDARNVDALIHNNPQYLMVTSAGNNGGTTYPNGMLAGYDKLTTDKNAKNNLVVANANPTLAVFTYEITNLVINGGSSQGPTDDLRIKPDITGDGTNLYSPIPNDGYASFTGTSMSSPNVTGTLVLLQEYYKQLNSKFMLASTLKGLACHTAKDDTATVGPDPKFGWGFLDALKAANVISGDIAGTAIIDELTLDNGNTYTLTFSASAGDVLSATICWTDLPGAAVSGSGNLNNSTPRLINDLDLRISKGSETYLPWKLDFSSGTAFVPVKADNKVDNIERVDINVPETGVYTLTVSHKGTLQGNVGGPFDPQSQDFSLILTGNNLTLGTQDSSMANSLAIFPNPSKGEFTISFDSSLNNNDNVKVDIYDISGRLVYKNSFANDSVQFHKTINLTGVASGVYLANISKGESTTSHKIIIE